jgi:hypothetical protein
MLGIRARREKEARPRGARAGSMVAARRAGGRAPHDLERSAPRVALCCERKHPGHETGDIRELSEQAGGPERDLSFARDLPDA